MQKEISLFTTFAVAFFIFASCSSAPEQIEEQIQEQDLTQEQSQDQLEGKTSVKKSPSDNPRKTRVMGMKTEMIEVCQGKSEGDTCEFFRPGSSEEIKIIGTCKKGPEVDNDNNLRCLRNK